MEDSKKNIFSAVFNFDDESRNDMLNISQYAVIALILVVLLNRGMETYMPEVEPDKGLALLVIEIAAHVVIMFIGLLFIHRIIEFLPTVSGVKYAPLNIITIILPTLVVLLNSDVKSGIGNKIGILWDRLMSVKKPEKAKPATSFLPQGNTNNPMSQTAPPNAEPDFNTMFAGNGVPDFEPVASNSGGHSMF